MSSINTNAGAMTALQTLKATNKALDVTQGRISTGYAVSEASHNAAYWSIATTMRSDNKALSTVQDALGLGSAQVDVAYTALDTAKDLIDEMKKKVIAASQPGVDKAKVQSEISQIQSSLSSLAESASFSGTNWLSVDSKGAGFNATEKVVAAFTRSGAGISLGTVDVKVGNIALFDKGGAGLLERAEGIDNAGILAETGTSGVTTVAGVGTSYTTTFGGIAPGGGDGSVSFDISVGGGAAQSFSVNYLDAAGLTGGALITAIQAELTAGNLSGFTVAAGTGNEIVFTANGTGEEAAITISDASTNAASLETGTTGSANVNASATFNAAFEAMTFDDDDAITFTLDLDGTKHDIRIDKATVDAAISGADGAIADEDEFVLVLNKALSNANLGALASKDADDKIVITSTSTGADSKVEVSALRHSSGSAAFDVVEMDISNATADQLAAYAQGLDDVFNAVVTAASDLGAIKSRIDTQKEFVGKLTDALSRGIGQLVDADMEAESARLQALQVQQQLGIQALSIANSNSQNILSLFR